MNKQVQLTQCPVDLQCTVQPLHHFSKYTPTPDMCGSGPVVGYPVRKHPKAHSVDLVTRKRHTAPALHPVGRCCAPCASGVALPSLTSEESSDDVRRRCHRGNLLQTISFGDEDHLIQAINTDAGSTIKQFTLHSKDGRHLPLVRPVISYKKDDSVYDLQCNSFGNETLVLTRSLYSVDLHKIGNNCLEYVNKACEGKHMLTSADLNNEEPGFWLQSDLRQKIKFFESRRKSPTWECTLPITESVKRYRWCTSLFGYRSYTGLAANRTSVYSADFRKKGFQSLFHAHGEKFKLTDMICGLQSIPGRPYLMCVLQDQLLLLDERNCRLPVVSWNHMLMDTPQRAVVFRDDQRDFVALSNNSEKKVCLVELTNCSVEAETYEHHTTASIIKHHNLFNPMQNFAHQKDLWFDCSITKRLRVDSSGLACHRFSGCSNLNLFVSNVCGDVFCQSFEVKDEQLPDPSIDMEKELIEHMKTWEESVSALVVKNSYTNVTFDVTHTLEKALGVQKKGCCARTTLKEDMWNVSEMVDLCRKERIHQDAIVDKRKLNWTNILVDEYKIDDQHITRRAPAHVVNHHELTEQFFSTAMHKRMKDENLEPCTDLLAEVILDHWPLNKPEEYADITAVDINKKVDMDTYRAVPYSLEAQGGSLRKYKPMSRFPTSKRSRCSSSRGSTAPSVLSDDDSDVTSVRSFASARSVGSARSDATSISKVQLRELLAATTPVNPNPIAYSGITAMASSLNSRPTVLSLTPSISNSSIKKKKKSRIAGF